MSLLGVRADARARCAASAQVPDADGHGAARAFVELTERIGRKTGGLSVSPFLSDVRGQRRSRWP